MHNAITPACFSDDRLPAGAVLADGLLMFDRNFITTLPPQPRASDVFVAWATNALISEGYLSADALRPPQAPPGSRPAAGATVKPPEPRSSSHGTDDPRSDRSAGQSPAAPHPPEDAEAREKLLARVRKLFHRHRTYDQEARDRRARVRPGSLEDYRAWSRRNQSRGRRCWTRRRLPRVTRSTGGQ